MDKLDLLMAMDFKDELIQIGDNLRDQVSPNGKVIFTTNVSGEKDLTVDEQTDFSAIKQAMMGNQKALIVRMSDDDQDEANERSSFETIAHLFTFCKTMLDKYILVFNLLKLAILEGKTVI